ncbi:MAG TPA: FAD:protein FMN transferase [Thermoanaerobaculia bacterium]|nr:FAD:protein FMN transferase [Thermoanaerobaculia bacterium]
MTTTNQTGPKGRPRRVETTSQLLPILLLLAAASKSDGGAHSDRVGYLMGTVCEISSNGNDASTTAAFNEIARVESSLSTWRPDSELSKLNRSLPGQPVTVSDELFEVLSRTMAWSARTKGAFNPLVGRLIEVWALRGAGAVPDGETLVAARDSAQLDQVALDPSTHTIRRLSDARFEEGAFGKGYALDRATALLRARGVSRASINFGGQIALFGSGSSIVEIASPLVRTQPLVRLRIPEGSLSTSGGSEKTFTVKGRTFIHIVDPRTGQALPPRGSVSVFSTRAFDADVLSTALFVLGPGEGMEWADTNGVAALFLTPRPDGSIELRASKTLRMLTAIEPLSRKIKLED